jgi:P-type Ca2+ transporter type 2C
MLPETHRSTAGDHPPPWSMTIAETAERHGIDTGVGLSDADARSRSTEYGPNELDAVAPVPLWRRVLSQFTDRLILILLGAAAVSFVVNQELKTSVVILVVVIANAVIGLVQEGRAGRALDALRDMSTTTARVRRSGRIIEVDASDLVPGDVVVVEAGNRIPADGRLFLARQLEVDEAALTGESQPVAKSTDAIPTAPLPIGDRRNLVFMNTSVTRGRGEVIVIATGMGTEMGRLAGLLSHGTHPSTPLQRQLHGLGRSLARLAGVVVTAVIAIGLARGQSFGELFDTAVALAVASIPEGLPAVTAVTLALGVQRMAAHRAIVKRLAAVETLGCTTVICSDKTGTLTLNQMTVRELFSLGRRYDVTGEGYAANGSIEPTGPELETLLVALALCNDASVLGGELIGDPTEGALVTLAAKGGLDVGDIRRQQPRLHEAPFDSSTKFMATVHRLPEPDAGGAVATLYAKGAPDVLLKRVVEIAGCMNRSDTDSIETAIAEILKENDRIAAKGRRVLAVASRSLDLGEFERLESGSVDVATAARGLTLLGLVGIVDPPRAEARQAIAAAHRAGIHVKMITGDHATTATTIARDLGLEGETIDGVELDAMSADVLAARLDDISVFARVSPEHKLRLVDALQSRGDVVAMTGDGVNDAPALERADMGIAMGITGTDVTKEAATMILADDNFATIVRAVEEGRSIYANIVHFVRFQLSTTLGFAVLFLGASLLGIAGGKPFTAIAILWVNLIMDGPPAMALGVDRGEDDVMDQPPRSPTELILTRSRWWAIGQAAVVMAVGTLAVLELAPGNDLPAGTPSVGGTMAFTTFVLFQFFNILNARSDHRSVFQRRTFTNRWLWGALVAVVLLQVVVVHVGPFQRLFDTTSLTLGQWAAAAAVASTVVWADELRKLWVRRAGGRTPSVS